jgi:hypothetical protein
VALANESMAETSNGQPKQIGAAGQGRERPREGQGKVELVGWLLFLGEQHDGIFKGQQDARINVEGQVEVEWAPAPLLGVKVDFPHLTQGVCLDEMPLVVNMESVIDGVIF